MKAALNWIGAVAALISAVLWFYSAMIEVPDNIDAVVGALQHIAASNGFAAMAAFVSALCFGLAGLLRS
jgi:hypothetical protein